MKAGAVEISVIVKAVNGRFLEPRFHLPKEYLYLESRLKKSLMTFFRRGTVDIFVHRRGSSELKVELNHEAARKWVRVHRELARSLRIPLKDTVLMERVFSLPQIFDVKEKKEAGNEELRMFFSFFQKALKQCDQERLREGTSIRVHLRKILKSLIRVIKLMENLRFNARNELENRLKERFQYLSAERNIEPSRFSQELMIYLDKSDIAEEIERLKEHAQMCSRYLASSGEIGKKLDFYSQELLREVNTIGSKANYAPLTEQVVQAKGLIEAFKEQVQNVE